MKRLLSLESFESTKIRGEDYSNWIKPDKTFYEPSSYYMGEDVAQPWFRFYFILKNRIHWYGLESRDFFIRNSCHYFYCFPSSDALEFWMNDEWEECFKTTINLEYRP
uniref:Uncharacterized protein n=1 Tax=Acrobeloides nanus TaxID=290746 RepID=A0A914D3Q5_9BILA